MVAALLVLALFASASVTIDAIGTITLLRRQSVQQHRLERVVSEFCTAQAQVHVWEQQAHRELPLRLPRPLVRLSCR